MTITDRDLAIAAAGAGAAVVRSMYRQVLSRQQKTGNDFATEADIEAERHILDLIRTARPGDAFIGEESGLTGDANTPRRWLVDPLCGTLNFAAQTPLVAVNVALRTGSGSDTTTAAASADPFSGEIFWTDGTEAAVRRDGIDEPLVPSADSRLVDLNVDPPFPTSWVVGTLVDPEFTRRFRARVISSTLAVVWVAAGRRAAYVTDGDLRDSVHFASGIALCQAAGCVVTALDGRPFGDGPGLLAAADNETHTALLDIVAADPTGLRSRS